MSELTLIEAVEAGDYQKTEELIRSGSDINQSDHLEWTPDLLRGERQPPNCEAFG